MGQSTAQQRHVSVDARSPGATRQGALPKYLQLSEMLTREVLAGRLAPGTRLPPERDMASELGVSVGTLRKALHTLEDGGLLDRIHGSGNYIRNARPKASIYRMFRLEKPDGGGLPTAEVLHLWHGQPPAAFATDLPQGDPAWRVRRIRSLDGQPVAAEEIWFHARDAEDLSPADLSESLYLFYREHLGRWISEADDAVGVGIMPAWVRGLTPGAPAGHITRRARSQDGTAIEYSQTWFDPDRAVYMSRLT